MGPSNLEYLLKNDETFSDENKAEKISSKVISMRKFRK